ncbi:MAG: hypothetical protein HQ594_07095 [Candidatus Omnitrophica bacterium]|nr:hypothetical protein [Candidatus Omnitrophota bacterium]
MKNILGLLIGAVVAILGLILLLAWGNEFLLVLKGVVPVLLIAGGIIGIIAGLSEYKDLVKSGGKR